MCKRMWKDETSISQLVSLFCHHEEDFQYIDVCLCHIHIPYLSHKTFYRIRKRKECVSVVRHVRSFTSSNHEHGNYLYRHYCFLFPVTKAAEKIKNIEAAIGVFEEWLEKNGGSSSNKNSKSESSDKVDTVPGLGFKDKEAAKKTLK